MIHILTGIPTYYAVLSKLCIKCKIATDSPEDAKWQAKHAPNCPKQFDGTAMQWKLIVPRYYGES